MKIIINILSSNMKQLRSYINIRKNKSTIEATNKTIYDIVVDELNHLGLEGDLNHIDVSGVTNMMNLFNTNVIKYSLLNKDIKLIFYRNHFNCDVSKWNVSNVRNMYGMFCGCIKFNCDISEWDVSSVDNSDYMFYDCKNFNQDLSMWNFRNNNLYENMFHNCPIKEEFKPKFK